MFVRAGVAPMIEAEHCDLCGMVWVRASEPFAIDELLEAARKEAGTTSLARAFGNPVLLDFCSVNLMKFDAEDFRRVVRKRLEFSKEHTDVPYALIARSDADYGMLRMYATYVEIAGLRSAKNTCVTRDFAEGMKWLSSRSRCTNAGRCSTWGQVNKASQPD